MGCGFNYFQVFHHYEYESYPHNIIMEFVITFGLLFSVPVVTGALLGMWRMSLSHEGKSFLFYCCLFLFGLSLTSGTLIYLTSIPTLLFFAYYFFCNQLKNGNPGRLSVQNAASQVAVSK